MRRNDEATSGNGGKEPQTDADGTALTLVRGGAARGAGRSEK